LLLLWLNVPITRRKRGVEKKNHEVPTLNNKSYHNYCILWLHGNNSISETKKFAITLLFVDAEAWGGGEQSNSIMTWLGK